MHLMGVALTQLHHDWRCVQNGKHTQAPQQEQQNEKNEMNNRDQVNVLVRTRNSIRLVGKIS